METLPGAPAPLRPEERFSNRSRAYALYRPSYPAKLVDVLRRRALLRPDSVVADIGSGAGHSSSLFLANGNLVYAVEPNAAMRAEAEARLRPLPRFHSVEGSAEATTLPDACADFVVAATAFHWFQPDAAKREFQRILKPGGLAVLLWQARREDVGFSSALAAIIRELGTAERGRIEHSVKDNQHIRERFFGRLGWREATIPNAQHFDWEGLRGRILSMSFMPVESDPAWPAVESRLQQAFAAHHVDGRVTLEYRVHCYFGPLD